MSIALGSRKPCSTSVIFRLWSPAYIPRNWGKRGVRLVDDHEEVFGEEVDERVGRLAGLSDDREVAGVVLDARTMADLEQHLHVEARAGREALLLEQLAVGLEGREPGFSRSLRMSSTAPLMRSSGVTKCLAG